MTSKINAVVCGTAFGRFYLCAVFDTQWPQAINRALDAFIASIGTPVLAQHQSARALNVTRSWYQISTLLCPPH